MVASKAGFNTDENIIDLTFEWKLLNKAYGLGKAGIMLSYGRILERDIYIEHFVDNILNKIADEVGGYILDSDYAKPPRFVPRIKNLQSVVKEDRNTTADTLLITWLARTGTSSSLSFSREACPS